MKTGLVSVAAMTAVCGCVAMNGVRPLPVMPAPFEKTGSARQPTELLTRTYKSWVYAANFSTWSEYKSGDRTVLAAGEDQRIRLSGGWGAGAMRTLGFGRMGVYAGKHAQQKAGRYLLATIRFTGPGEDPAKEYPEAKDEIRVDVATKVTKLTRTLVGRTYGYDVRTTGPGVVEIGYDADLAVTVAEMEKGMRGVTIRETKPAGGMRGRIVIDLGEADLPRVKPSPAFEGMDFWAEDAYHVPVRSGRNLLANPGFEGGLRNWVHPRVEHQPSWDTVVKASGGKTMIETSAGCAHSGHRALHILTNNHEAVWSMPVAIQADRPYTVSWYEKADKGGRADVSLFDVTQVWPPKCKYNRTLRCANPPDGKPDANGWVRRAFTFSCDKPGVQLVVGGKAGTAEGTWIDDVQLEAGDRVTDYDPDPVCARVVASKPYSYFRLGEKMGTVYELSGKPGLKGEVTVTVSDFFSAPLLKETFGFALGTKGLATVDPKLDDVVKASGVYTVRFDYAAAGRKWTDYARFHVVEPLGIAHPTAKAFCDYYLLAGTQASELMDREVELGWGSKTHHSTKTFKEGETAKLYRRGGILPLVRTFGGDLDHPEVPGYEAYRKLGGFAGFGKPPVPEALEYVRKAAYKAGKEANADDLWWCFGCEEDSLGQNDAVAENYAHYQKAARDGLKKAFDERGLKLRFSPTHGTTGGSPNHVKVLERYLKAGRKIGLEYDFVGLHQSWALDGASVGSWEDREQNHDCLKAMLRRFGRPDLPFAQCETFYLLPHYIPLWGCIDWCDDYFGQGPSMALGNREFLHACLMARMYLLDLESWPQFVASQPWMRNFTFDWEMSPYCWTQVANTLGRLLPDPRFVARVRPIPTVRGNVYRPTPDATDGVLAVWTTDNDCELGFKASPVLKMRLPAGVRFTDLMGAPRTAMATDGVTEVPLTSAPLFITGADADALVAAMKAAECPPYDAATAERFFNWPQPSVRVAKCGKEGPDWEKIASPEGFPDVKFAWNDEALFIRGESADKGIFRIGFDGLGNARKTNATGIGPDDQIYDFRGAEIVRVKETSTQYAHRSINKPTEEEMCRDFGRKFTPKGKGGVWELKMTYRFTCPFRLEKGSQAGFKYDFSNPPTDPDLGDPVDWMMLELTTDEKERRQ